MNPIFYLNEFMDSFKKNLFDINFLVNMIQIKFPKL